MIIEEVFAKRKEARSWEEYHPHELAEMLECALLHIITLEVQATHLTKRALDEVPECDCNTAQGFHEDSCAVTIFYAALRR